MDENNNKESFEDLSNSINENSNKINNNLKEGRKTYKAVSFNKKKKDYSFSKSVVLPFTFGVLGCSLVLGLAYTKFGLPNNTSGSITKSTSTTAPIVSASDYSGTAVQVAENVLPSIVGIKVEYTVSSSSIFMQQTSSTGSAEGSGIIISDKGYILTNNHIVNSTSSSSYYDISKATKLSVYLYNDSTEYPATIVGTDSQTDLAIIKIEKDNLSAATLGDSAALKVGEFAMAIGNPLGMQSSVTCGIISALNRDVTDSNGTKYTLIQTDAAINSGNSGGALVNSKGEVIGINTLKLLGTGIEGMGFAIPINDTLDVTEELITYNKVRRPYIGIAGIDVDEELSKKYNLSIGIYVQTVENFSAAEKAGLKVGDMIIKANDTKISTMDELNEIKNKFNIGDKITLTILRNGAEQVIEITLGENP